MQKIANAIGFTEKIVMNAKGRSGGICMMWSEALEIDVIDYNSQIIAINIKDGTCSWSLVGFYGPTYQSNEEKPGRIWQPCLNHWMGHGFALVISMWC